MRAVLARKLFDEICEAAWAAGDPGLIFLDAIARANPLPAVGGMEATNPCGELPLLPYESCNLGSIVLVHFVRSESGQATVDYERLRAQVRDALNSAACFPIGVSASMQPRVRSFVTQR